MARKKTKKKGSMPGFSKSFFSNDLIERFIRVEQNVSSSFGEKVPYKETEYYKSLSDKEKKKFDNYLKNKKGSKKFLSYLLIVPVLLFLFFGVGPGVTGSAVGASGGDITFGVIGWISVGLMGAILASLVTLNFLEKKKDKMVEKHLDIIENMMGEKYSTKKDF